MLKLRRKGYPTWWVIWWTYQPQSVAKKIQLPKKCGIGKDIKKLRVEFDTWVGNSRDKVNDLGGLEGAQLNIRKGFQVTWVWDEVKEKSEFGTLILAFLELHKCLCSKLTLFHNFISCSKMMNCCCYFFLIGWIH